MKGILKWPLIVTAVVVVLRVLIEQWGAPNSISKLLSVVVMHSLIVPIYLAIRIAIRGVAKPYRMHLKLVALYVVLARAMLLPAYWLARIFHWPQGRFGGVSGSSAFRGFFVIPFATAAFWILFSIVFGGLLGFVIIAIVRRFGGVKASDNIV